MARIEKSMRVEDYDPSVIELYWRSPDSAAATGPAISCVEGGHSSGQEQRGHQPGV